MVNTVKMEAGIMRRDKRGKKRAILLNYAIYMYIYIYIYILVFTYFLQSMIGKCQKILMMF